MGGTSTCFKDSLTLLNWSIIARTMYQSTVTPVLCRKLRGEQDTIDCLDLSNGFVGPQDLVTVSKCIQQFGAGRPGGGQSPLVEIDLSGNHICGVNSRGEGNYDSDGISALGSALASSRVLKTLNLDQNFLAIPGCTVIGELLTGQSSLRSLSLRKCKISSDGALELSKGLKVNRSLTNLNIAGNALGAPGISHIANAISDNKRSELKLLDLSNSGVDVECASVLCNALQNDNSLAALVLDDNMIGDEGTKVIGNLLARNKKIAHISMHSNQIGNDGARWLAQAFEKNRSVAYIGLQLNSIDSTGARYLAKGILQNTILKGLSLMGNNIDKDAAGLIIEASMMLDDVLLDLDILYRPPRDKSISNAELEQLTW